MMGTSPDPYRLMMDLVLGYLASYAFMSLLFAITMSKLVLRGRSIATQPTVEVTPAGAWTFFDQSTMRGLKRHLPIWGLALLGTSILLSVLLHQAGFYADPQAASVLDYFPLSLSTFTKLGLLVGLFVFVHSRSVSNAYALAFVSIILAWLAHLISGGLLYGSANSDFPQFIPFIDVGATGGIVAIYLRAIRKNDEWFSPKRFWELADFRPPLPQIEDKLGEDRGKAGGDEIPNAND